MTKSVGYQILGWDTELLGKRVARILATSPDDRQLGEILASMRSADVGLAYWASPEAITTGLATTLSGYLVDRKATFGIDFRGLDPGDFIDTSIVGPHDPFTPIGVLERLAVQGGGYSRFSVDPRFPRDKFEELYKTWIRKSVAGELADEVLTIRRDEEVVGLITLVTGNGSGDIGLIAVDKGSRGMRFGETLVRAAQRRFIDRRLELGQVVTQSDNIAAGKLFEKCGYSIKKVEYVYHFWLQPADQPVFPTSGTPRV